MRAHIQKWDDETGFVSYEEFTENDIARPEHISTKMIENIHKAIFKLVGALVDNHDLSSQAATEVLNTFLDVNVDYVRKNSD